MPFISIQLNSNRPQQVAEFFDSVEDTADAPEDIEILLHIDEGDAVMEQAMAFEQEKRRFTLRLLKTDLVKGYATLWMPLNPLWKMTHPDAYFVINLSDEMLFKTKSWDSIIRKYEGYYPDHIFRLRGSKYRFRNYTDFWECGFAPDSLAFYTRRWLELSGDWNPCLGPDSFQQCVAFYLFTSDPFSPVQYNRDIALTELAFTGEGAGIGLEGRAKFKRILINNRAWFILMSRRIQQEARRRAMRMKGHIIAHEQGGADKAEVTENKAMLRFTVRSRSTGSVIARLPYGLSWARITLINIWRARFIMYYAGDGRLAHRYRLFGTVYMICTYLPYGTDIMVFFYHMMEHYLKTRTCIRRSLRDLYWKTRIYIQCSLRELYWKVRALSGSAARKICLLEWPLTKRICRFSLYYLQTQFKLHTSARLRCRMSNTRLSFSAWLKSRRDSLKNNAKKAYDAFRWNAGNILSKMRWRKDALTKSWIQLSVSGPRPSDGQAARASLILFSLQLSSNRPKEISALLNNLEAMTNEPASVEVLVSIDSGDAAMEKLLRDERKKRPFRVRCLAKDQMHKSTDAWKSANALFRLTDPNAYFIAFISDDIRFETRGWDTMMKQYVGYYPDHIFRVRASDKARFRNYVDSWECAIAPDNLTFHTQRWLALQGDCSPCAGVYAFQQTVSYYLFTSDPFSHTQYYRDIAAPFIRFSGDGAQLKAEPLEKHEHEEWLVRMSQPVQENARRRAMLLKASIIMDAEQMKAPEQPMVVLENPLTKTIVVKREDGTLVDELSYRISRLRSKLRTAWRARRMYYYTGGRRGILRAQTPKDVTSRMSDLVPGRQI